MDIVKKEQDLEGQEIVQTEGVVKEETILEEKSDNVQINGEKDENKCIETESKSEQGGESTIEKMFAAMMSQMKSDKVDIQKSMTSNKADSDLKFHNLQKDSDLKFNNLQQSIVSLKEELVGKISENNDKIINLVRQECLSNKKEMEEKVQIVEKKQEIVEERLGLIEDQIITDRNANEQILNNKFESINKEIKCELEGVKTVLNKEIKCELEGVKTVLNKEIDSEINRLKEEISNNQSITYLKSDTKNDIEIKLPRFSGDRGQKHPGLFMHLLKEFFVVKGYNKDEQKITYFKEALEGDAANSGHIWGNNWDSFVECEEWLMEHYWSKDEQKALYGNYLHYQKEGKITEGYLGSHVLKTWGSLRYLTIHKLTEEEFCDGIVNHFKDHIRYHFLNQKCTTVKELINKCKEFDRNSTRKFYNNKNNQLNGNYNHKGDEIQERVDRLHAMVSE